MAPENPWTIPGRHPQVTLGTNFDEIHDLTQECSVYARETFPEAARRIAEELPPEASLSVTVRGCILCGAAQQFSVYVDSFQGDQIVGRVAGLNGFNVVVDGDNYEPGDTYSLTTQDIVDWTIEYRDRPQEGNLLGRYLLLKQDGLVSEPCDPQYDEFQHFRLFRDTYSFVPPNGPRWHLKGKHYVGNMPMDMSIQQEGVTPYELNTLSAMRLGDAPFYETEQKLVDALTAAERVTFVDTSRYTFLEHEVTAYTDLKAKCALSHRLLEDAQALLSRSGERGPMIREVLELSCVHPSASDLVVQITYSHRYQDGFRNPDFVDQANRVFQSIAFTKFET
jgi:hypothetical protein